MKKVNLKRLLSGGMVLIAMVSFMNAQTPATTDPGQVQPAPPTYPVPPSPVTSPNQVPQNPTIPKITIPIHAPADSLFKKTDDTDKPFRLHRPDSSHNNLRAPRN